MSESFKKQKKIDGGGVATPAMAEELLASMTPEAIKTALIDL